MTCAYCHRVVRDEVGHLIADHKLLILADAFAFLFAIGCAGIVMAVIAAVLR